MLEKVVNLQESLSFQYFCDLYMTTILVIIINTNSEQHNKDALESKFLFLGIIQIHWEQKLWNEFH